MRKLLVTALTLLGACASASPPPGGPEDKTPPKITAITPDSNAVNARVKNVSFQFDEVINDRGSGTQEVGHYFLVSPSDGEPNVSWHRSRIDVRPRHGFKDNTAYTITLLPGLSDLRNNPMKTGTTVVFSTGPTIPRERVTGYVIDWITERPAANALIEAITPDSLRYLAQADSTGRFTVGPLPNGPYVIRGIIDANNNRALDRTEFYDSVGVVVPHPQPVELLAAARDTFPARLLTIDVKDSLTITATFDRALDPLQTLSTAQFHLVRSDSTAITIANAYSPRDLKALDSVLAVAQRDSARRADSVAGKQLAPTTPVRPDTVRRPANGKPAPLPPPKPSKPGPFTSVTLKLAQRIEPAKSYRVSATDIRALSGKVQSSERSFTAPRPKAASDSTKRAPADTLRRAPGDTLRRPPADTTRRAPTDTTRRPAPVAVPATPPRSPGS